MLVAMNSVHWCSNRGRPNKRAVWTRLTTLSESMNWLRNWPHCRFKLGRRHKSAASRTSYTFRVVNYGDKRNVRWKWRKRKSMSSWTQMNLLLIGVDVRHDGGKHFGWNVVDRNWKLVVNAIVGGLMKMIIDQGPKIVTSGWEKGLQKEGKHLSFFFQLEWRKTVCRSISLTLCPWNSKPWTMNTISL